ncbi:MAG: hypothetical protein R3E89_11635 [Thiolinea sp.]
MSARSFHHDPGPADAAHFRLPAKFLQLLTSYSGPGRQTLGVHLDGHKNLSSTQPVLSIPARAGDQLVIPLQQHMGHKPDLCVGPGDYVYKGQALATMTGTSVCRFTPAPPAPSSHRSTADSASFRAG